MNPEDFVIACRTLNRSDLFMKMTYAMLERNNLTDKLFVFVQTSDDLVKYSHNLHGKQYAGIVLGPKGINQITNFICDYFPINQRIVFVDDDNMDFYTFSDDLKCIRKATNLSAILTEAFETIDKYNCGLFGMYWCPNKTWIEDKPVREFGPLIISGALFGARNQKHLLVDLDSDGCEDLARSMRYWNTYGGALLYWRCGIYSQPTKFVGGLQGTSVRTPDYTNQQIKKLLTVHPEYQRFCQVEPKFERKFNKYSFHFYNFPKRKKVIEHLFPTTRFYRWSNWFQDEPDKIEPTNS